MREDTFSSFNPAVNFIFFIGAVVFGMFIVHPVFMVCSVVTAFAYYATVKGTGAVKLLVGILPVFVLISLFNPLVNTRGETVLFMLGSRPYTLEALYYGMSIGGMFAGIILWFASYSCVMTSDKFMYIFGRLIPSVSLVLTMILRLIPSFRNKTKQIAGARMAVGKWGSSAPLKEKINDGATILSSLTGWALEGGIVMGDSMRSRGYGSGKRTSFSIYRFDMRDIILTAAMMLLMGFVVYCCAIGVSAAEFTPDLRIAGTENPLFIPASAAYFLFLIIPTGTNIAEEIKWRILRSKI
ncbi:MAG: energy-coupling factor transporter transmembrane component T [Firmicutes bacterium]|nr:energy-coupling factor transporter transmembrane component T [Bacillota bacterium]